MIKKRIIRIVISIILILGILFVLQRLLVPKYVDDVVEGALIAEYYDEPKNHDVIFVGDCEVYENISPLVLYDEYGINSYIRGSAQQLIWQSYYLMEDTLKYEKPKVMVFNVLSLKYNEPQHEAYNRMTLEGMRWSMSKVNSIKASMTDAEHFIEYVFPILRYHSRITELKPTDIEYLGGIDKKVSHNGYYMRVDVRPADFVPDGNVLGDYNFGENAMKYLDMMTQLCKENNVELLLIKAPSLYPYWYPEWETQVEDYAKENGLNYINCLEYQNEIGLDYSLDTYDAGLHLNLSGAEKLSRFLGKYLVDKYSLSDRRDEEPLKTFWNQKREEYYNDKNTQLLALSESTENIETDQNDSTKEGSLEKTNEGASGYGFNYLGTEINVDVPSKSVIEALGEPVSFYEAVSCAFEGLDKIYTYPNFQIETYPLNNDDYISTISLKDDSVSTKEGVVIGASREDVIEKYGNPSSEVNGKITYEKDNMLLNFIIRDNSVALIEYKSKALEE